jgi:hypothetical protein
MKISLVSLRCWYSVAFSSSRRFRRALPFDWRPLAACRAHSSSFWMAFWRAFSLEASCFRR